MNAKKKLFPPKHYLSLCLIQHFYGVNFSRSQRLLFDLVTQRHATSAIA